MDNKYALSLRRHADKAKLWPGDNDFADAAAEIERLELRVTQLNRLATDRRYFMEAYEAMLGENGLKVAAMWKAKKVLRVHHSWGPEARKLTGEERAEFILEWEEAARHAVPVESIDGPLPTP